MQVFLIAAFIANLSKHCNMNHSDAILDPKEKSSPVDKIVFRHA